MKKGLFYLALILFLVPSALAHIAVYGPDYSDYNIGNKLSVTVSVSNEEELQGLLKVNLKCGTIQLNYFITPIELISSKEEKINIPPIVITKNLKGNCIIEASLYSNEEELIENAFSENFKVDNSLDIAIRLDKTNILPYDKLRISGTAKTIRDENIKDGTVEIIISDYDGEFSTLINNGNFDYTINFGSNIRSGSHSITAFVEDNLGNTGAADIDFTVEALPTELKNSINQLSFKPEEVMELEALLFDQVGDLIITNVLVTITDPSGNKILEKEISTESVLKYTFQKYDLPGRWLIRSKSGDLNIESYIDVEVIETINFLVDGQNLIITNTGNIVYRKPVSILFGDTTITKKTSLKPGETVSIDLSKEVVEPDSYNLEIISGIEKETFEDVLLQPEKKSIVNLITGNFVLGTAGKAPTFVYYIIMGIILIGFLMASYFGIKKGKQKKVEKSKEKEKEKGKKLADTLRERKEKEKEKEIPHSYDRKEAIKRFRERIKLEAEAEKNKKKPIFGTRDYVAIEPKEEKKPFSFMVDKVKEEAPPPPSPPPEPSPIPPLKEDKIFEEPLERKPVDFTLDEKKEELKKEDKKDIDESSLFKMFD